MTHISQSVVLRHVLKGSSDLGLKSERGRGIVSKEVGEEERGGCVHSRSDWEYVCERTPSATSIPQSGLEEKEEEEEEKLKFICQCTLMML